MSSIERSFEVGRRPAGDLLRFEELVGRHNAASGPWGGHVDEGRP